MSNRNIFLVGGFLLLFWYYSQKVEAAKALMIRYQLPQQIRIQSGALRMVLPFIITNPTATPITLQRYYFTINLEGTPIGTAYGIVPTTIIEGMETQLLANVVVPIDALISAVPALRNTGSTLDFTFTGAITAEFITIPISQKVSIPIPKII